MKRTSTRTELPSCEAIDVRKVNIGSIVRPVTKFKAGKNLKGQTEWLVIVYVLLISEIHIVKMGHKP